MRLFVLALFTAAACGPTVPQDTCTPFNCAGCCRDGACVDGRSESACGINANACDVCVDGQQCVLGRCTAIHAASGGGSAATGGGAGGGGANGDGGGGAAPDACTRYVSCTFEVNPQGAQSISNTYGTNGSCWQSASADVCLAGCVQGLYQLQPAQCARCRSNADCPSSRVCDTASGECVACVSDAQCASGLSCDTSSHTCRTWTCTSSECTGLANGEFGSVLEADCMGTNVCRAYVQSAAGVRGQCSDLCRQWTCVEGYALYAGASTPIPLTCSEIPATTNAGSAFQVQYCDCARP
jgi:hypothetical protein